MLFYLDLDSGVLVNASGGEASEISGKRGPASVIAIKIFQNGSLITEEIADLLLKFVVKDVEEFDDDPLVSATGFVWSTTRLQYESTATFITEDLNERFGAQGDPIAITGVHATDLFSSVGHGLAAGDPVWFSELSGGAGITEGESTKYFVIASGLTADDFRVSSALNGVTINFTSTLVSGFIHRDPEDVASIELAAEIAYRFDPGDPWQPTENDMVLTLRNNYIRDDDGAPADPSTSAALLWLLDHAIRYDAAQTISGGNTTQFLTNLNIPAFIQTLLDDTTASAAQTTLGISTFIKTLLDDADAGAAQTTLGISTFIKTLLDDANAAAALATLTAAGLVANTFTGVQNVTDTTEANILTGAAAIKTAGGIYAAKQIVAVGGFFTQGFVRGKVPLLGHLWGMRLANGTDATNDIDIAEGSAADCFGNTVISTIGSGTITKRLDAAWAVGSGNGGLDQGSIANASYHLHAIRDDDNGVSDFIFSLSHDKAGVVTMTIASPCVVTMGITNRGHGLVAGSPITFQTTGALPTGVTAGTQYYVIAAGLTETQFEFSATNGGAAINSSGSQSGVHTCYPGPKLPTNYTSYRRIGSIVRAGATILAFVQDGDVFSLITPVMDASSTSVTTSRTTFTLSSMPTGLRLRPRLRGIMSHATAATVLVTSMDETDAAPSNSAAPLNTMRIQNASSVDIGYSVDLVSNTLAQIAARSTASSTTVRLATLGWIDTRGRDE